ncbi:flagellar protein FliS [Alphaproteobacteria bacterium]|nr:flagellar protein FliS [Alphaproteobacteria bacterium]
MNMNFGKVSEAYKNAERQAVAEISDPHAIILTMFDELLRTMLVFSQNADLKAGGVVELKSKNFARAITIIYALQSSLDFEKGGDIANNLFRIYEYCRQQLLADMKMGNGESTEKALEVLSEIRDAWEQIKPE